VTAEEPQSRLWQGVRTTGAFLHYASRRFIRDGCLAGAGALSYTTLVSLVPLTAIVTAVFSAFPIFSNEREEFLGLLAHYFIPEVGEEAGYWFKYFASIAAQTTAFGVIALAVTAVLLLTTIEDQLHAIWRVRTTRPWLQRVLAYWAVLTFGPLLLGMGLSLSSYLEAAAHSAGLDAVAFEPASALWLHRAALILPFTLEAIACTLVYKLIPSCTVRWREGLLGGVVAALAIELLKIGFSLYIARFSSYRTIYGAVAAVPIFLLWMYITWGAVLFGAVVAAAMPQWRIDFGEAGVTRGGRHLGLALAFLAELADAARRGAFPTSEELAQRLGITASAADDHLGPLLRSGFVAQTTSGGWVLGRPLSGTTLFDLYRAMRLPLADDWRSDAAVAPWQRRVVGPMQRVVAAESSAMRVSLAELLGIDMAAADPPPPIDLDSRRK
jgi:membrane protein